jgi:hypothetical protein
MAVFERLPDNIRKAALDKMTQDEEVKMCFVAGSSLTSNRDYVVITSKRVLVIDERILGSLGKAYVNVRDDIPLDKILSIDITRTFMNKLLGSSNMGLQVEKYKYLINNGSKKEIQTAAKLITDLAHLPDN